MAATERYQGVFKFKSKRFEFVDFDVKRSGQMLNPLRMEHELVTCTVVAQHMMLRVFFWLFFGCFWGVMPGELSIAQLLESEKVWALERCISFSGMP